MKEESSNMELVAFLLFIIFFLAVFVSLMWLNHRGNIFHGVYDSEIELAELDRDIALAEARLAQALLQDCRQKRSFNILGVNNGN